MRKLILASASAIAMLGLAACSDATDDTTTQSVPPVDQPADTAPGTDGTTTQSIDPAAPAPAAPAQ